MADKLDWLDKHLILLRYLTVSDVVEKENYKIRPDLAELFAGVNSVEEMTFNLAKAEKYKEACELLAYIAHRQVGVWWGYQCLVSLLEELGANPPEDRDIADIAKDFKVEVPDFAKVKLPDPPDMSQLNASLDQIKALTKDMREHADPVVMKMVDDAVAVAFREFKKVHGMDPIELVKKVQERASLGTQIDPNSPIFKARDELRAQLQTLRKETVDTIKSVIPPKVPEHEKKIRDNALSAVYRWIVAPDEVNSKKCLDIGNECPDTPAGLLALSSFWAFGDLMPEGDQIVPTPPGLAPNGLCQVLLMCALHKGGTRKLKERYEHYFNLGVEILSGKDNWEKSLAEGQPLHETLSHAASPPPPAAEKPVERPPASGYKRWKPENPGI
ncbi:MAG: hypothetical protein LBP88_03725 [Treponema sp.]|nr:hypothetical protein [Treponema sp.]